MKGLREQAIAIMPAELGLTPTPTLPNVCTGIMELGFEGGAATMVAVADGTASLYFSNGGGIIGAGRHESVRRAAERFLASAERSLGAMAPATDRASPVEGHARFFVRTYIGLMSADAPGEELATGSHPLSALFFQGHDLVTAIREVTEATSA